MRLAAMGIMFTGWFFQPDEALILRCKMQKKKAGFSYVEVLAAGALFMLILTAALNLTLGARQNLSFARENQRLGLLANSLSLAVRDLLLGGTTITDESVENLARGLGIRNYGLFIFGPDNRLLKSFHSSDVGWAINLSGFGDLAGGSYLVYVVVLNNYDVEVGRAISVVMDLGQNSVMWGSPGG